MNSRLGDGADEVGVANHAHKGHAVAQLLHHVPPGPLAEGADDGRAGDEDLFALLRLTPDTVFRDLKPFVSGVDGAELVELFHQQRALTDDRIQRHVVAHFDKVNLLALHAHVDGALHAGDAAAKDHHAVGDGLLVLVLVVDKDHVLSIQAGDRRA